MTDRRGIVRTAKEALMCKSSSSILRSDDDGTHQPSSSDQVNSGEKTVKKNSQNPLLNRMYHARYQIVHKALSSCLGSFRAALTSESKTPKLCCQILLLGAGVDVTFESLYSEFATIFAVDLPEIIAERDVLLKTRQNERTHCLDCAKQSVSIAADLRDIGTVWSQLLLNGYDKELPTIILIECVMCYIDTTAVQQMLLFLSDRLNKQSLLISYDPMLPFSKSTAPPSSTSTSTSTSSSSSHQHIPNSRNNNNTQQNDFKQMMSDKFHTRKAPIRHSILSKEKQISFLKLCNWCSVRVFNMYEALHSFLSSGERSVSILLEPFDEYSSLALIHKLYGMTIAGLDCDTFNSCLSSLIINSVMDKGHVTGRKVDVDKHEMGVTKTTQNIQNNVATESSGSSSIDNDDSSLSLLIQRISLAESRVEALEQRARSIIIITSGGVTLTIREADDRDAEAVMKLFKESFSELSEKYLAVRKFVKKSVKSLKNIVTEYPRLEGSNFWVAEIILNDLKNENENENRNTKGKNGHQNTVRNENENESNNSENENENENEHKNENENENENKVIVGCVGFKVSRGPQGIELKKNTSNGKGVGSTGNAAPTVEEEGRGEVSHMCVGAGYRKMGIATGLMEMLVKWAREGGYAANQFTVGHDRSSQEKGKEHRLRSLDLTVLTDLLAATAFYRQSGFTEQGDRVDLGNDCYLQHMVLQLD